MGTEVSLLAAFVAGTLSFSSPCVLPLVPIYLAHLAGVSVGATGPGARGSVLTNAAAYVAGFSLIFVALGAALGAAGVAAGGLDLVAGNRVWLVRLGGALLVLLGLHQLGIVTLPFLQRQRRWQVNTTPGGEITSSFLIGVTFGAGWTPCVGPILGAILTMAAGQGGVGQATTLLAFYSAGMAVPFMAVALAFGSAPDLIRRLNRRLQMVSSLSGAVLLGVGAIMLLGIYEQLFTEIIRIAPWAPWEPEL